MKKLNFNNALGDDMSPFAPNKERIAPAVLGAIIAGGATLAASAASTIGNALSNKDTNATNLQMNENQLANQRFIHDQDIIENRRLIDQAYERNLPINQVKNLKEAGINPAFAMESGSFGSAQAQSGSVPSAPSAGTMHPSQPMDYSGLGVGVGQAAQIIENGIIANKEQDRADYALASQIEVEHMNARVNMLNAIIKAREVGINENWLERQWEDMNRRYWLEVDKNTNEKEDKALSRSIDEKLAEVAEYKAQTERLAAQSNINLNQAAIGRITQEIEESKERVLEMKLKGYDEREINAYIASKEKALANIAKRESEKVDRQAKNHPMNIWEDFAGGLLSPLKGLVTIGGKF